MAGTLVANIQGPPGAPGAPGAPGPIGPPGLSNAIYSGEWNWTTKTTDASTAGQVGTNDTGWAGGTQVNINEQRADNTDVTVGFSRIEVGDDIRLQAKTDGSRWVTYQVTGLPTDQGTWWSFPVAYLEGAGTPPNGNTPIVVSVTKQGAGGGVPEGGSAGQVLAKNSATDYDTAWVNQTGGGTGADEVFVGTDAPVGAEEIWYDTDAPTPVLPPGPQGPQGIPGLSGMSLDAKIGANRLERWVQMAFDPPPAADIPVVSINAGTGVIPTPVTYTPLRQTPGNNATNVDTVNDPVFAYSGVGVNGLIPAAANNIYVNGDTKPGGTAQAARMLPMFEWVTYTDQMELRIRAAVTNQALGWLEVNGRWVQETAIPLVTTAGSSYYVKLTFPSAGVRRHIRWIPSTSLGLASLNLPAGSSAAKPVGIRKRTIAVVGDSFVNGSGSSPTGATTSETFALRLAYLIGADAYILAGIGGTKWLGGGAADATGFTTDYAGRMPWVLAQNPDVIIFNGSVNDTASNQANADALTAAVKSCVSLAAAVPEVYVCGTWRVSGTTLLAINNAVKAGAAQAGRPFLDLYGMIYGTGKQGAVTGDGNADFWVATDGIHPSHDAHKQAARLMHRAIATAASGQVSYDYPRNAVYQYVNGQVTATTEDGITTTYTYNPDGTVHSDTRGNVTRIYSYNATGDLIGIAAVA